MHLLYITELRFYIRIMFEAYPCSAAFLYHWNASALFFSQPIPLYKKEAKLI